MAFLHGTLNIKIEKANKLPNLDKSFLSFGKKDVSDPFVVVSLKDVNGETWKIATTRVIDDNLNPIWDENFQIDICHEVVSIIFTVRDKDFVSSENLGSVSFPANTLNQKACESGTFDLVRKSKKKGTLTLIMSYTNKDDLEPSYEVPDCLFPLRQDNQVKLYQDACCPSLPLPLVDAFGYLHQPCNTWYDIYKTIMDAKHFIYITGWSVSTKTTLIRDEGNDNRCLGELLKQKAYEGVQVRLLLWDEVTSTDLNKGGIMSTNDEETSTFFKGTSVKVVKACRDRHTNSMFSTKVHFTMLCFSHHQKCVIADAPINEIPGQRKLVAYVGGLDLTSGRYDTPEHPLFHTLLKEHKDDFYNQVFPTLSNKNGPRQPWHDIHSCVEGPAAHDVLSNFLDRWHKQAGHHVEEIMKLQEILNVVMEYHSPAPDRWNVQIFRSINSDSAMFNWTSAASLKKKKGRAFDNSLHRAYIHNIRRARRCIYIENQYFMGSSHMWYQSRDANASNLVPLEISIKIEEKIRARERFAVYIIIPMFPEGKPADKVTQEILYWQSRTLQMMYSRIAVAIRQAGIEAHPQEYLLVLCLGSKESPTAVPQQLVAPEDPSTSLAFKNRRHMIYVHSKMAIFDDEYIIVGSANINDRSLNGNRDTEIAMGSYQPIHTASGHNLANGGVSLFRKALWAEHMGTAAPINIDPSSIECMRSVRWLAEEALRAYIEPGDAPTPRHLLLYPLQVNLDGTVCVRPDCPTFPDTSGSVIGARSNVLPTPLTT